MGKRRKQSTGAEIVERMHDPEYLRRMIEWGKAAGKDVRALEDCLEGVRRQQEPRPIQQEIRDIFATMTLREKALVVLVWRLGRSEEWSGPVGEDLQDWQEEVDQAAVDGDEVAFQAAMMNIEG